MASRVPIFLSVSATWAVDIPGMLRRRGEEAHLTDEHDGIVPNNVGTPIGHRHSALPALLKSELETLAMSVSCPLAPLAAWVVVIGLPLIVIRLVLSNPTPLTVKVVKPLPLGMGATNQALR